MKLKKYICMLSTLLIFFPLISKNYRKPDVAQKQFEKANTDFNKKNYGRAIKRYRKIVNNRQDLPHVYFNLGIACMQIKEYDAAVDAFTQALRLKNDYPKAALQLGKAYTALGKIAEAQEMYVRALNIDDQCIDALLPLAKIHADGYQFDEAISLYKKAVAIQPKNVQAVLDLANTLNMHHQTDEALTWYFKLLDLMPNNPSALYNIAYTLKKLNRLEEALPYYHRVLEINPNHTEAHFSYGLALLLTGNRNADNWTQGWAEYEWRRVRHEKNAAHHYTQPAWNGSDLHGKTLLIWSEQTLGDTFQFIRYAQVAKSMGAQKVIAVVQDAAYDIIKLCPYIDKVLRQNEQTPPYDFHAPLLSMPYYTKTRLNTVPHAIPYLFAKQSLVEEWRDLLSADTNFKIGICWQGNLNYSTQFLRTAVATKYMTVTHFLPLTDVKGVSVYSLQKMQGTNLPDNLPDDSKLITFAGDFDESAGRFMDTAAIMQHLDLVISIDTSVCHLAAGLGVPTWTLLPNPPDWRWMLDCDNTPWYPNMRLFRQPTPGDWDSVMRDVVSALKDHLEAGAPLIACSKPLAE